MLLQTLNELATQPGFMSNPKIHKKTGHVNLSMVCRIYMVASFLGVPPFLPSTCIPVIFKNKPTPPPPPPPPSHPSLFKFVAQGALISLVSIPTCIYAAVHVVILSKNHQRSNTVQEEGLTNEGSCHLLFLHRQAHDKRHCRIFAYEHMMNRARLIACEMGVAFFRGILQLLKIRPPHPIEEPLTGASFGRL